MLSTQIKEILDGLSNSSENDIFSDERGPAIHVNKLTGKLGSFYEKLRYAIDYKEKHTIERNAIERILKRGLFVEGNQNMGLPLLQELVGGGYLPNKEIPEAVAEDLQEIIDKYIILGSGQIEDSRLISIIASEIEAFLHPQTLNNLVLEAMYKTVSEKVEYSEIISKHKLNTQIYIACRRSLLEDDFNTALYSLILRKIPNLPNLKNEEEIKSKSADFIRAIDESEKDLQNNLSWKISPRLKNQSIYFSLIKEIIEKHQAGSEFILNDPETLEQEIKEVVGKKYTQQEELVSQSGTRAVIYLFVTKIIFALVLELPYEIFILSSIHYLALSTNILFHPLLLLFIVKTSPKMDSENTSAIVNGIKNIVQGENVKTIYIKNSGNDIFMKILFGIFYGALFLISFGAILWVLEILHFNIVSILLFLFFLTLVSSFGFRIRHTARKWEVHTGNEGVMSLLWGLFTMPIVRTGRWLSRKFSSINIFVFFMDFILETPFKFILGTFDSFIHFLKEKEEDGY